MSDLKVLSVQKRAGLGKGANRRARQEELIPGVFYTAKGENLPVQMSVRSSLRLAAPPCSTSRSKATARIPC